MIYTKEEGAILAEARAAIAKLTAERDAAWEELAALKGHARVIAGAADRHRDHERLLDAENAKLRTEVAQLRKALREQTVNTLPNTLPYCTQCHQVWRPGTPESHAPGCLAEAR